METNHENINNHCNNRTTAHISHKHVHSTLQTTLIQMMLFVWVTPQRCGRKVDRTLCLCIYGKECRIDRTLYSTLLNSTHFFSVVDRTPTHYFWSTGWEVISKSPSHYSMGYRLSPGPYTGAHRARSYPAGGKSVPLKQLRCAVLSLPPPAPAH